MLIVLHNIQNVNYFIGLDSILLIQLTVDWFLEYLNLPILPDTLPYRFEE